MVIKGASLAVAAKVIGTPDSNDAPSVGEVIRTVGAASPPAPDATGAGAHVWTSSNDSLGPSPEPSVRWVLPAFSAST